MSAQLGIALHRAQLKRILNIDAVRIWFIPWDMCLKEQMIANEGVCASGV